MRLVTVHRITQVERHETIVFEVDDETANDLLKADALTKPGIAQLLLTAHDHGTVIHTAEGGSIVAGRVEDSIPALDLEAVTTDVEATAAINAVMETIIPHNWHPVTAKSIAAHCDSIQRTPEHHTPGVVSGAKHVSTVLARHRPNYDKKQ